MSYSLEVYYHGEWHFCEVTVEKINATKLIFKELELNLDECILTHIMITFSAEFVVFIRGQWS